MRGTLLALVFASAVAIPPAPARWITDDAGALSSATIADVDARLEGYERTSGHQVVVYVGKTTGGVSIEEWAAKAFEKWGVGRKGKDDGAALFVFMDDRRARVEVGYGLEDRLTDLASHRLLEETVLPELRSGDPDGAIRSGVEAILAGIDGRAPPAAPVATEWVRELTTTEWILIAFVAAAILAFAITHPRLALWLLVNIATNARRSGGGRRRGFGGSGGRSGGGGASGSW